LAISTAIRVEGFIEAFRLSVGKEDKFVHFFDSKADLLLFIELLEAILTSESDVETSQLGSVLIIQVNGPDFAGIAAVGILLGRKDEGELMVDPLWTQDAVDNAR
jgi:hypothetical protein